MKIYGRSEWGARPATAAMDHQQFSAISEVFVHHADEAGAHVRSFDLACQIVRGIQAFHIDGRGWSDVGYHYVIVPQDRPFGSDWVFAGRDLLNVPAAQLGHNVGTCAICIVQKDPEPLKLATIRSVAALARRLPQARRLRGHYEVTQTECPGPIVRAQLDHIARRAGKRR